MPTTIYKPLFKDSRKIFPKFSCYRFARLTHSGIVILNLFQNLKDLSLATVTTPTTLDKPLFKDSRKIFPKFSYNRFARLTHSGLVILNLFQNLKNFSLIADYKLPDITLSMPARSFMISIFLKPFFFIIFLTSCD